jgi:hypothetical protein
MPTLLRGGRFDGGGGGGASSENGRGERGSAAGPGGPAGDGWAAPGRLQVCCRATISAHARLAG